MSFVDDLNRKVSQNELLQAESKHIKMYVMKIVDAVKQSCLSNKDKHITSGYFGCIPYDDIYTLVNEDDAYQIDDSINVDTLKKSLSAEIEKLGFIHYEIKINPYKEKIKRKFFGFTYYDYKETSYFTVWLSLKW